MGLHSLCQRECTPDQIADILYKYFVENKSAHRILHDELGLSEAEINKMGKNGPFNKLKPLYKSYGFAQKFSNYAYPPYESITYEGMREYVRLYWNKPTTERDLVNFFPTIAEPLRKAKEWDKQQSSPDWGSWSGSNAPFEFNFDSVNQRTPTLPREPRIPKTPRLKRRRYYSRKQFSSDLDFSWIKKILHIILAIVIIVVVIGCVKALIPKTTATGRTTTKSSFGKNYQIETYEYNGHKYIGNQKRNKPDGINLRYISSSGPYELGTINKKEVLSGEGVSYDGRSSLIIGKRKKDVFNKSWCIRCQYPKTELAVFKDNTPQGLVINRVNSITRLMNYSKNKVIATYQNGDWIKPNGKPLKLKNDASYKGIILKDATHFTVDGIEFCIDCDNLCYKSQTFEFEGTYDSFMAKYNAGTDHINLLYEAHDIISMDLNGTGWKLTYQKSDDRNPNMDN